MLKMITRKQITESYKEFVINKIQKHTIYFLDLDKFDIIYIRKEDTFNNNGDNIEECILRVKLEYSLDYGFDYIVFVKTVNNHYNCFNVIEFEDLVILLKRYRIRIQELRNTFRNLVK